MSTLKTNIHKAIEQHDEDCDVKVFAEAVSDVIKESYGKHTFKIFMDEVKRNLETEEEE